MGLLPHTHHRSPRALAKKAPGASHTMTFYTFIERQFHNMVSQRFINRFEHVFYTGCSVFISTYHSAMKRNENNKNDFVNISFLVVGHFLINLRENCDQV